MAAIQKKIRSKDKLAAIHQKNIAYFFRAQKAMVMKQLGKRTLSAPLGKARELEDNPWNLTQDEWDRLWQNVTNQTTPELQKIIASAEADALHAGANNFKLAIVGVDPSKKAGTTFNLANPRAVQWFQQNGGSVDYIKGIQSTTSGQIKTIIKNALDTGQAYNKTAKEISDTFDGMSRDRAQRIAVYETGQSYEAGNRMFADSLVDDGVEMEEMWMTSHDEKVRPEHAANEAEGWVSMDHVFSSGDTEPPTDPGCRCYMIYRQAGSGGGE
jgi:SPP1 gp7 family putative phage head morphogenesis protein